MTMKTRLITILFCAAILGGCGHQQQTDQPYAGEQSRAIKALSQQQIDSYLAGDGMGFAKTAELNEFPGPRHVLDLQNELNLQKDQQQRIEEVFEKMNTSARELGKQIIDKERELDRMFSEEKAENQLVEKLIREIAALEGELRWIHIQAHLEMKELLSAEQIDRYNELRGYTGSDKNRHEEHNM